MDQLHLKYEELKKKIKGYDSLAVAFSAGVDSTFLLKTAHDLLGDRAIAITAKSAAFPNWESKEAEDFCKKNGIRQFAVNMDQMDIPGFSENGPDRCYLCKRRLFERMIEVAKEQGCQYICDGSNKDDEGDYRPGLKALKELGILSPFREYGFTKQEIRTLSAELGLSTAGKPSYACLASRFVYGEEITEKKLSMVEQAENFLKENGFQQFRVRIHGDLARIEVLPEELERFSNALLRKQIYDSFQSLGFQYITLDLLGYRSGSMNEILSEEVRKTYCE